MGATGDEQLVSRYKETGEIRFFDELVRGHLGRVRSMVYPMVLNHADADEVTQEVFLRVVRSMDRFRQRTQFSSWLHRITMNTTYSFLRARSRRPITWHADPPRQEASQADPAAHLAGREHDGEIGEALRALSPKLRAAITLTAIQGMPVKDAARAAGCPVATLYWRVHEARKILKKRLSLED
jgi:RNA polymerase sigma-70 factor (ECF subfamily)